MTKERQKKLTGKRWLILTASCLINLCIGSLYAWSVFAAAGYVGPTIMSAVFGRTGSYVPAFWIAIGLAAAGLVLSFVYRRMQK